MRYWIYLDNKVQGPFEKERLASLTGFGSSSMVCEEGKPGQGQDWKPAARIPDLKDLLSDTAPAQSPPQPSPKPEPQIKTQPAPEPKPTPAPATQVPSPQPVAASAPSASGTEPPPVLGTPPTLAEYESGGLVRLQASAAQPVLESQPAASASDSAQSQERLQDYERQIQELKSALEEKSKTITSLEDKLRSASAASGPAPTPATTTPPATTQPAPTATAPPQEQKAPEPIPAQDMQKSPEPKPEPKKSPPLKKKPTPQPQKTGPSAISRLLKAGFKIVLAGLVLGAIALALPYAGEALPQPLRAALLSFRNSLPADIKDALPPLPTPASRSKKTKKMPAPETKAPSMSFSDPKALEALTLVKNHFLQEQDTTLVLAMDPEGRYRWSSESVSEGAYRILAKPPDGAMASPIFEFAVDLESHQVTGSNMPAQRLIKTKTP